MVELQLPDDAEERIERQLSTGKFHSAEEVVDAALTLLEQANPVSAEAQADSVPTRPEQPSRPTLVSSPFKATFPSIPAPSASQQLPLFESVEPLSCQPWTAPLAVQLTPEEALEKERLLAAIAESRLGTMEEKVAFILRRFPETRDSFTATVIRYWMQFEADAIERWDRLDLDVLYELSSSETIARIRRHIQNDLGMFEASEQIRSLRRQLQAEFGQYLAAEQRDASLVRFFLDETGNEGGKTYKGVAGICVIEWRQYQKHHAALSLWRQRQGWPETIHFADSGTAAQPKAMALIAQLQRRRGGLLFVGYSMHTRGSTQQAMLSLFIQLITDSLRHLQNLECLSSIKALDVVKEADEGFDALYLESFKNELGEHLARQFPNLVFLKSVTAVPKGREVFLECADLIASSMQRRAARAGRDPKDTLAEAVFNTTGFEDPADNGTVFRAYVR